MIRPAGLPRRWRRMVGRVGWCLAAAWLGACATSTPHAEGEDTNVAPPKPTHAEVLAVQTSGSSAAFTFAVENASPDTGCDHYADWWEVVSPDGTLLYRRILLHSHVDEQPFTRSGGPVAVSPDQDLFVRVHMHPDGYAISGARGSVGEGFSAIKIPLDFAAHLESAPPLPDDCAF